MSTDRIKTVLMFWFNAMRRCGQNDVKNNNVYDVNTRHCTSIYVVYVNGETRKTIFYSEMTVITPIFENFVSEVIPVAVVKMNKIAVSESPRMGVNKVCLLLIYHARNVNRWHGSGNLVY